MTFSRTHAAFLESIKGADNLVGIFDELNAKARQPKLDVLKPAVFVMATTAWATFIDNRLQELPIMYASQSALGPNMDANNDMSAEHAASKAMR